MSDAGASAEMISFLRVAFAFVILMVITLLRHGGARRKAESSALYGNCDCDGIYYAHAAKEEVGDILRQNIS